LNAAVDKVTVHLSNKRAAALRWQWGSPTHETLSVAHVTSVTHSHPLQTPYYRPVVLHFHTLTLSL